MKKLSIFLSFIFVFSLFTFNVGCSANKNARSSYYVEVSLDGTTLSGSETVEFYNSSESVIQELKFNLFANAFRKGAKYSPIAPQHTSRAYPNGISYGEMTITNVKSGSNMLDFSICGQDENILSVELDAEIFPEERVSVTIDFTLNLANVVARTGYNAKTINLANFYPILCALDGGNFYECVYYSTGDPFYSDCADYKVKLITDKNLVIAGSGEILSTAENGDKKTTIFELYNARSVAFVLSEDFDCVTDESLGVKINYYYYDDEEPNKSLEFATKSMALFGEKFGEYPYKTYSVAQTPFVQGGMEFPSLVMIADDLKGLPYGEVIVHETAHQWWQSVVGNNEIEYGFLDEGLAEYSVVLFYENFPEYGYTREGLIKSAEDTFKVFCSVSDKVFGKVNTAMIRGLKDFSSEYEYVNIAYVKPCVMYDYLRKTIGEERFFKGLRRYYKNFQFLNATPDDLVGTYEKIGADTNGFFESFFSGKEIL